jgi:hypothetical protein
MRPFFQGTQVGSFLVCELDQSWVHTSQSGLGIKCYNWYKLHNFLCYTVNSLNKCQVQGLMITVPATEDCNCSSRSSGQKVSETLFQPISLAWWHMPVILAIWETYIGGSQSRFAQAKTQEPI